MKDINSSSESKAINKVEMAKSLFGIIHNEMTLEQAREERLRGKSIRSIVGKLKPKTNINVDETIDLGRTERAKKISVRNEENHR